GALARPRRGGRCLVGLFLCHGWFSWVSVRTAPTFPLLLPPIAPAHIPTHASPHLLRAADAANPASLIQAVRPTMSRHCAGWVPCRGPVLRRTFPPQPLGTVSRCAAAGAGPPLLTTVANSGSCILPGRGGADWHCLCVLPHHSYQTAGAQRECRVAAACQLASPEIGSLF